MSSKQSDDTTLLAELSECGLKNPIKIANTLQGSIWRTLLPDSNKHIVVKVTNKSLQSKSIVIINGRAKKVHENIVTETEIQKYLTYNTQSPNSIVKYIHAFQTHNNYFLLQEYGGTSLFDFIVKLHHFTTQGTISIKELQKIVKIIFKQMIECIEYIHKKNVCHLDISLENFLINDVDVTIIDKKLYFDTDMLQIKLCDFGLACKFESGSFESNKFCGKSGYQSPEISNKQNYCAKSNDIWCLCVCLWMMSTGTPPFVKSNKKSESFNYIMNGNIEILLNGWNKMEYVNKDIIYLFELMFKYEKDRCDLESVKNCEWLKN